MINEMSGAAILAVAITLGFFACVNLAKNLMKEIKTACRKTSGNERAFNNMSRKQDNYNTKYPKIANKINEFLICNDCGRELDEFSVEEYREYHNELEGNPYETFLSCRFCGSLDLSEAKECKICQRVLRINDLKFGACAVCRLETASKYKKLMLDTLELEELELINDIIEDEGCVQWQNEECFQKQ